MTNVKKGKKKNPNEKNDDSESESNVIPNFREQVAALVSFKEALCNEKCNLAITNAFRDLWIREQEETNEDTKLGLAICLSYIR